MVLERCGLWANNVGSVYLSQVEEEVDTGHFIWQPVGGIVIHSLSELELYQHSQALSGDFLTDIEELKSYTHIYVGP